MNCDGHVSITEDAFRALFADCGVSPNLVCDARILGSNLNQYAGYYSGPDYQAKLCVVFAAGSLYAGNMVAAVDADLSGHFLDSKQRYHFMRGKKETTEDARRNGVAYIREQTELFVREAGEVFRRMPTPTAAGPGLTFRDQFGTLRQLATPVGGIGGTVVMVPHEFASRPFINPSRLARALHALQDSFSPGHAERDSSLRIKVIFLYSEQDHNEHQEHDHASGMDIGHSMRQAAVTASRDLIELALRAALRQEFILAGWAAFEEKWLK